MLHSLRALVALMALAAIGFAAPASANSALPDSVVPEGLGVNIHFTDPAPGEMAMLAAGGFRWVRMDFGWEGIEREPGRYDFSAYDRLLSALEPYEIRPILLFDYANPHYDGGLSPHTDRARAAFARWVGASVRHFRGRGVVWEIYNEPNIQFWRPFPNVADYAKLALAVGRAIRAAAPGELYVGPAISRMDLAFLEKCFRDGLLAYWDAVTIHPYRTACPETAAADYRRLRRLIARFAPRGKPIPILSGEWGFSAVPANNLDTMRQGKYLARQYLTNLANDVPLGIWYDWRDDGTNPQEAEHHFGTVENPFFAGRDPVYEPKPAYLAARTLADELRGFRFNKALATDDPRDHILLFARGDDVRVAAWSEVAAPHAVRIPASAGTFRRVSFTGGVLPPLRADGSGLRVSLDDGPVYFAPDRPNDLLRIAAAWARLPLEVVSATDSARLLIRLMNPLNRSVDCVVVAPGCRPLTRRARLAAGAALDTTLVVPASHDLAASPAAVSLSVGLSRGAAIFLQTVVVESNHPLGLALQPLAGQGLRVAIRNPNGGRFAGFLTLHAQASGFHQTVRRRVLLEPSVEEYGVSIRLDRPISADLRLSADLSDTNGAHLCSLSGARLVPVNVGAIRPGGNVPPALIAVPDRGTTASVGCSLSIGPPSVTEGAPGPLVHNIRYRTERGTWLFRTEIVPTHERALPGRPRYFGLWVCGDGNDENARIRFADSTGQQFIATGDRIRGRGWRFMLFPMNAAETTHSGGANDGVIHYPVRIQAPLLMWNGYARAVHGQLAFACPTAIY